MAFTSWSFVALAAGTVLLYYWTPGRWQWLLLLAASVVFYAAGGWGSLCWLAGVIAVTWLAGLALGRLNEARRALPKGDKAALAAVKRKKKAAAAAAALLCFGLLYAMKYWDFTVDLLPASVGGRLPRWDFVMPLGLSFFTFQAVGYVIDVYRDKYAPQKNPARYALFVSFFPQMVQGPIGRYDALAPQLLAARKLDWKDLQFGIQLALWGYLKKMVIADRAAVLVDAVITENTPYGGAVIAFAMVFYCIQLYCDFSGGIDITRGVARMLGIELAVNFRRPLFATSLTDYWRRWHITLGQWMRDYLFYPLSLSKPFARLGKWARKRIGGLPGKIFATSLATFVVYLVIGIWHGANFRYIAFGLWNGTVITASLLLERRFLAWRTALRIDQASVPWRVFMTARTSLLVFLGRYLTRAPRLLTALSLLWTTVSAPRLGQLADGTLLTLGLTAGDLWVVALGALAVTVLEFFQERGVQVRESLSRRSGPLQWLALAAMLAVLAALGIFRAGYISSEFIYGQF